MDKSWLKADRRTKEFKRGVEDLLLFASHNGFDENKISCPCIKCAHSKSWKARAVKDHLFLNAHLCVLQNTTVVGPYFAEHMAFLLTRYPEHENDEMWLKNKQNETFPKWFKEKIASDLVDGKEVPQEISYKRDVDELIQLS
ncbi:hypothetical protein POM88_041726 [Heracleum sosnowskyi]|uniref:Transposase-associated domain-containing protein n=1 Tax=Heracleum sosnowskyi TaxID=360622 RepID=A0AAD8M8K5_9APIA|nr:hypothetical protein POM88_041726 [Heracleum sosnowskyi]